MLTLYTFNINHHHHPIVNWPTVYSSGLSRIPFEKLRFVELHCSILFSLSFFLSFTFILVILDFLSFRFYRQFRLLILVSLYRPLSTNTYRHTHYLTKWIDFCVCVCNITVNIFALFLVMETLFRFRVSYTIIRCGDKSAIYIKKFLCHVYICDSGQFVSQYICYFCVLYMVVYKILLR